jgi:hypothetical protein
VKKIEQFKILCKINAEIYTGHLVFFKIVKSRTLQWDGEREECIQNSFAETLEKWPLEEIG